MKKLLLPILLLGSIFTKAQSRFSDYQDFIRVTVMNEDSIKIAGSQQKYTIYTELCSSGTPMKEIFKGDMFDRTVDNLYFSLKPTYYKLYIPEGHILFTISSLLPEADIANHFLWLTNELRKFKKESYTRSSY